MYSSFFSGHQKPLESLLPSPLLLLRSAGKARIGLVAMSVGYLLELGTLCLLVLLKGEDLS